MNFRFHFLRVLLCRTLYPLTNCLRLTYSYSEVLRRYWCHCKPHLSIRARELLEKSYAFSLLISKGRYSESNGQESHNVPVVKSPFSQRYPSSGQCLVSVSFDSHRKAYSSWNPKVKKPPQRRAKVSGLWRMLLRTYHISHVTLPKFAIRC
ncbi:PREDICTED: uncharacterized protein LOC107327040 isoform X2 [Acropora digitifera]|uniref:uncharacterized protein LOC107327040 isoform X2 n=1 Tax=Acropora digitifera TaxID=70779 RepID=UPI00077A89AA|nr:PREDICTED: uncharacterized protein LOC107327040 isoform X2 [Acropora digitifera]